jgi:hypothetical protein
MILYIKLIIIYLLKNISFLCYKIIFSNKKLEKEDYFIYCEKKIFFLMNKIYNYLIFLIIC